MLALLVLKSNKSLRPSKLQNHRDKNHQPVKEVGIGFFAANQVRFDTDRKAILDKFWFLSEEKPGYGFFDIITINTKSRNRLDVTMTFV